MKRSIDPFVAPGRSFGSSMFPGRILVLVRLQGRLFLWGLSDKQQRLASANDQSRNSRGWLRLPLEQLYPSERSLKEMVRRARDRVDANEFYRVTMQFKAQLSIELYAYTVNKPKLGKGGAATVLGSNAFFGFFHPMDIACNTDDTFFSLWGYVNGETPKPQNQDGNPDGVYSNLGFNYQSVPGWSFSWSMKEEQEVDLERR